MAALSVEECKRRLLARLWEAGPSGLNKTALGIKDSKAYAAALRELEGGLEIGNLGTPSKSRYVHRQYYRPLELAYEHMESKSVIGKPKLYIKRELEHGLRRPMRSKCDEAISRLIEDGKLIRLKRGNASYFLHTAALPNPLPSREQPLTRGAVLIAYKEAVHDTGFTNVLIEELRRRLDVPLPTLHELLKTECREGRAVPSRGDSSLATEATRAAALHLDGGAYLLIRFEG